MKSLAKTVALCALLVTGVRAHAAITVGLDPTQNWIGYMNVFNLPSAGGGYQFGSGWGTADLCATFTGPTLKLTPNTINDPSSYWYTPSGGPGAQGNKIMDANFYVEDSTTLPGQEVTFTADVLQNTLVDPYTSVAFIKDFAPDYSSSNSVTQSLTPGVFSITLATAAAGHHIQYGFETVGPDVWATDVAAKGFVTVAAAPAVPEPSSLALLAGSLLGLPALKRFRKS